MKLESKAKHYTDALFTVAEKSKSEKEVKDSINLVNSVMKESSEFRAFLLSKRISDADKAKVVQEGFGEQCHPIVCEFIGLASGENLIKLFQLIEKLYSMKYADVMNHVEVTAHVSDDLDQAEQTELKSSLDSILGKTSELNVQVDPNLLGGIKLRVGNKFLDASIQNHLDKMRQTLLDA